MSPSLPSVGGWQRLAGNRSLLLLCLLLFLLSGFLSFWFFFPAEVLQRRLVQEVVKQSGLQMTSRNSSLLFPLGIELDLKIFPAIEELAPIELQEVQLTPVWTTLFSQEPAVAFQGGLAGGNFGGQADQAGRVQLDFANIEVARFQNESFPYAVSGNLQGQVAGEQLVSPRTAKGEFKLKLSAAVVHGLEKFGLDTNSSLGTLELEGKFNQQRLSLEQVVMVDGLIEMSGGGTMLIGDNPNKTRLNLNIRLHPNQSTPAAVRDLLSMTGASPAGDGSYLLRVGGTLARPALR